MSIVIIAAQRIAGFDAYDAVAVLGAVIAGVLLAVRLLLAPSGQRHVLGRWVNELLVLLLILALAVLGVHQLITDDLCRGSC